MKKLLLIIAILLFSVDVYTQVSTIRGKSGLTLVPNVVSNQVQGFTSGSRDSLSNILGLNRMTDIFTQYYQVSVKVTSGTVFIYTVALDTTTATAVTGIWNSPVIGFNTFRVNPYKNLYFMSENVSASYSVSVWGN